jgi:hypothetical protein
MSSPTSKEGRKFELNPPLNEKYGVFIFANTDGATEADSDSSPLPDSENDWVALRDPEMLIVFVRVLLTVKE